MDTLASKTGSVYNPWCWTQNSQLSLGTGAPGFNYIKSCLINSSIFFFFKDLFFNVQLDLVF